MEKIKKIEELAEILKTLRGQGKKIVHCHGVFDLLHIGHIRYFEQAGVVKMRFRTSEASLMLNFQNIA